jgi:hypothetical protein
LLDKITSLADQVLLLSDLIFAICSCPGLSGYACVRNASSKQESFGYYYFIAGVSTDTVEFVVNLLSIFKQRTVPVVEAHI